MHDSWITGDNVCQLKDSDRRKAGGQRQSINRCVIYSVIRDYRTMTTNDERPAPYEIDYSIKGVRHWFRSHVTYPLPSPCPAVPR